MTDRPAASAIPDDGIPDASAGADASRFAASGGVDDATVVSDATAFSRRPKPPRVVAPDDDLDRTHLADRTAPVRRVRGTPVSEPPSPRRAGVEPIPDAAPLRYAPRPLPPVEPSPSAAGPGPGPLRTAPSGGPAPDIAVAGARRRRASRARLLAALVAGCAVLVAAAGILIAVLVNAS